MGQYGSIWVDTEGIRSHVGYKVSGIAKRDLVCHIISKYFWTVGLDKCPEKKLEKYTFSGGQGRVYKILVRPAPTFLAYSGGLGSHIWQNNWQIYLINLFIPC